MTAVRYPPGSYRHKATGAVALVTNTTLTFGTHAQRQLELLTEPTEEVLEALHLTWHQTGEMIHCCALGEHSYPRACPLHHMTSSYLAHRRYVDPFTLYQPDLDADWEKVAE